MSDPIVEIYDLMACNVYMDFDAMTMQHRQHKFLVAFKPTGAGPVHEYIDTLVAHGPDGYHAEIANEEFSNANPNGYIFDRTTGAHWYMHNIDGGFLESGEYTIEATLKDGSTRTISRVQDNEAGFRLLEAYLDHRDTLGGSWEPARGEQLSEGIDRTAVEVSSASLKELSGVDAFHILRLCRGASRQDFDTQDLYWWDNIFLQRLASPDAGLNRNRLTIGRELEAEQPYVYFTELTDSNAMGSTNMCVFQPHQTFRS